MSEQLIIECKKIMKENLVSIIKFGTEGEPNNILIVTKRLGLDGLEKMKPMIQVHARKTKVIPTLFTKTELGDSADVFPLEILDMKYPHEVLYGDNVINEVKLDKKHVRRQLEFELRSKLIHLRENFIWIKKPKDLKALLKSAVPTLMPLFYGLLFLKNVLPSTELDSPKLPPLKPPPYPPMNIGRNPIRLRFLPKNPPNTELKTKNMKIR